MADHPEESLIERIADRIHGDDVPSSFVSGDDRSKQHIKSKIYYRVFSRQLKSCEVNGGKPADNRKASAGVIIGGATAIWVLFELLEYRLLTPVCHTLILALAVLILWSKAAAFINKSPPHIPEVSIPEDLTVNVALALRYEINRALAVLREIASGRERTKFFAVIAGLWVLSILGNCFNFFTLFYVALVLLHTVPVLYEKYEDKIDPIAEKAIAEIKKQYAVFDARVLSRIPRGPLKNKTH